MPDGRCAQGDAGVELSESPSAMGHCFFADASGDTTVGTVAGSHTPSGITLSVASAAAPPVWAGMLAGNLRLDIVPLQYQLGPCSGTF